jgi:hypothetical protein
MRLCKKASMPQVAVEPQSFEVDPQRGLPRPREPGVDRIAQGGQDGAQSCAATPPGAALQGPKDAGAWLSLGCASARWPEAPGHRSRAAFAA